MSAILNISYFQKPIHATSTYLDKLVLRKHFGICKWSCINHLHMSRRFDKDSIDTHQFLWTTIKLTINISCAQTRFVKLSEVLQQYLIVGFQFFLKVVDIARNWKAAILNIIYSGCFQKTGLSAAVMWRQCVNVLFFCFVNFCTVCAENLTNSFV